MSQTGPKIKKANTSKPQEIAGQKSEHASPKVKGRPKLSYKRATKTLDEPKLSKEHQQALKTVDLGLFGERVRKARLETKTTQRKLCQDLFTSAYLSSVELGKTRPTSSTLVALAQRLDKNLDYFLSPAHTTHRPDLEQTQAGSLTTRLQLGIAQAYIEWLVEDGQIYLLQDPPDKPARQALIKAQKALEFVAKNLALLNTPEQVGYHLLVARLLHWTGQSKPEVLEKLHQAEKLVTSNQAGNINIVGYARLLAIIELEKGQLNLFYQNELTALVHFRNGLEHLEATRLSPDDKVTEEMPLNLLRIRLWNGVASCNSQLGDLQMAFQAYGEAQKFRRSTRNNGELIEFYIRTAQLFGEQGDYWLAGLRLGRSFQVMEETQNLEKELEVLCRSGEVQFRLRHYPEAEDSVQRALKLSRAAAIFLRHTSADQGQEKNNIGKWELEALLILVRIRQQQAQPEQAWTYLELALTGQMNFARIGEIDIMSLPLKPQKLQLYQLAGEVQAKLGAVDKAEGFYQQALAIAEFLTNQIIPTDQILAGLYFSYGQQLKRWGQLERAFSYLELAVKYYQQGHELAALHGVSKDLKNAYQSDTTLISRPLPV